MIYKPTQCITGAHLSVKQDFMCFGPMGIATSSVGVGKVGATAGLVLPTHGEQAGVPTQVTRRGTPKKIQVLAHQPQILCRI